MPLPAPSGPKLKLFAFGSDACGVIAIGGLARGVVAIGVNAIGVVAIGVNAMGIVCAVGLNAVGLVGISLVNSIAVLAFSLVNAIGGLGGGVVNGLLHPVLGVGLALLMAVIGTRLAGRWRGTSTPPRLVRLLDVLAAESGSGWARGRLLGVEHGKIVVGDADGQHTLEAAPSVMALAGELRGSGRRGVLVRVEAERASTATAEAGYRVAAERAAVLRAAEIRPRPRRLRLPETRAELDWLMRQSLFGGAVVGTLGSIAVWLLRSV